VDEIEAAQIAEGRRPASAAEELEAYRLLVGTGLAWRLPGSVGLRAMALIGEGRVTQRGVKDAIKRNEPEEEE
jgi:hypothetical protein